MRFDELICNQYLIMIAFNLVSYSNYYNLLVLHLYLRSVDARPMSAMRASVTGTSLYLLADKMPVLLGSLFRLLSTLP